MPDITVKPHPKTIVIEHPEKGKAIISMDHKEGRDKFREVLEKDRRWKPQGAKDRGATNVR